jgi:hypothetical protein
MLLSGMSAVSHTDGFLHCCWILWLLLVKQAKICCSLRYFQLFLFSFLFVFCVDVQGELDEKDNELSSVKEDRQKLEKEMQNLLKKQKEENEAKGKGPGGMLHSALQQLQRELRRESVANEKLMVKAESLLKDGSRQLNGRKKVTSPLVAAQSDESSEQSSSDVEDTSKDKESKDKEEEDSEEGEVENDSEEAVRYESKCFACLVLSIPSIG